MEWCPYDYSESEPTWGASPKGNLNGLFTSRKKNVYVRYGTKLNLKAT